MKLYRVIVPVQEIDAAAQFYATLLDTPGERVSPGRHYFDLGGTILAVYDPVADGDPASEWMPHRNQYVYIAVSNLEQVFDRARVTGAVAETDEIASMPWGERLFYGRDPSGNGICFVDEETLFVGDAG